MSDPNLFKQFRDLAIQHQPDEAAAAGLYIALMAFCIMHETVTEAVDAYRSIAPDVERKIREIFPKIADVKTEARARHAARRGVP
jgi:hypothetical protein